MKIADIELINLDLPFTRHTDQHMQYWLPHWRIVQICKIKLDNGVVGWGETIPNYTWAQVPENIAERLKGREAASLLWQDNLGAGVQIALFDAVGKTLGVPVFNLLGNKVRDWCPISWWAMDMPPQDWARQCTDAVKQGYTTAKLKARTWYDLHAAITAIIRAVPEQFRLDLDFNGTLTNAASAVELLKSLEQYEQVAMIETPIPQHDVAANRHIRNRIDRPLAMHYGSPPIPTALAQDVTDGFVVCAGARGITDQSIVCEMANKPFWLQLVGTGITTTWAAHLGAVCSQAKWPAITCMNIWRSQLLGENIQFRGGYYRVPDEPGLGIEIDHAAIKKYRVDYSWVDPPRHVYRYVRASGETTYFGCSKQQLHQDYPRLAMPICEVGSTLEVFADNGSKTFGKIHAAVQNGKTFRKLENIRNRSRN